MGKSNMKWQHWAGKYTDREDLYLGKWRVASAAFNGMRHKDDPKAHTATCLLPGIKEDLGSYATLQEAQARAESAVRYWLAKTGIVEVS